MNKEANHQPQEIRKKLKHLERELESKKLIALSERLQRLTTGRDIPRLRCRMILVARGFASPRWNRDGSEFQ